MAFHDVRFPPTIAYGATGGPGFSTDVVTLRSGREKRNGNWSLPRRQWDVAHGLKNQGDLDILLAFFLARHGRLHSFRFKDWSDFRMPRQAIGVGDGATLEFALVKAYADPGGYTTFRAITKPVDGSVQVWLDGAPQAEGWACDHASGLVTFSVAPGAEVIVEAACEFDVHARFDTDDMRTRIDTYALYSWGQIPIVEIRE
jgi:uncharacterized protein (TIGR02217 family)